MTYTIQGHQLLETQAPFFTRSYLVNLYVQFVITETYNIVTMQH